MAILSLIVEIFILVSYSGAFLFSQYDINGEGMKLKVFRNIQSLIIIGIFGITALQLISVLITVLKSLKDIIIKLKNKLFKKQIITPGA